MKELIKLNEDIWWFDDVFVLKYARLCFFL